MIQKWLHVIQTEPAVVLVYSVKNKSHRRKWRRWREGWRDRWMGSSGFTSSNKSHISTGGGRELQGGKDEGLKKIGRSWDAEMCARRRANKEKMKRGKDWRKEIKGPKRVGDQTGWGNLFPPLSHWAPLRYSIVTVWESVCVSHTS